MRKLASFPGLAEKERLLHAHARNISTSFSLSYSYRFTYTLCCSSWCWNQLNETKRCNSLQKSVVALTNRYMVTSIARYSLMMTIQPMIWVGYPFSRNCLCILQETLRLFVIVLIITLHSPLYCKCCTKMSWRSNPYIYTTFLHNAFNIPWEWTSYILKTSREGFSQLR